MTVPLNNAQTRKDQRKREENMKTRWGACDLVEKIFAIITVYFFICQIIDIQRLLNLD